MLIESRNVISSHAGRPGPMLSVIVPCFNEELNLPFLYERLRKVLDPQGLEWELIAVDDHSRDCTFQIASGLVSQDARVRALRLARNVGSHISLMCGLDHAAGRVAVMIAADMQDPPEIVLELLERWRGGDQVVWAVRTARRGVSATSLLLSRIYNKIMRRIIGRDDLAGYNADVFLLDRAVIDALTQCREGNLSLFSLVSWLGFRQSTVSYVKEERQHGRSGWTFKKKLKLFLDSITAFSYFPIRVMSLVGISVACLGFLYAVIVVADAFLVGIPVEGWTSLMIVLLIVGGLQMTMLGVLGEYLWRALDESRRRPRYNVESFAGNFDHLEPRKLDPGKAAGEWKFGVVDTNSARPHGG
jgi:glycosyltransferase involved in cell wall biosynthesis